MNNICRVLQKTKMDLVFFVFGQIGPFWAALKFLQLKLKYARFEGVFNYSEVPNKRADQNKRAGLEKSATLLAYLQSKLINEQGLNFSFIT